MIITSDLGYIFNLKEYKAYMDKILLFSVIFLLLLIPASAVEEPAYTEIGFDIGEVYEFVVLDIELNFFGAFPVPQDELFTMKVNTLPEEGLRASQIEFTYENSTYLRPMHADIQTDYFIYNNWEFWVEKGTYNQTYFNTTSIGSVSSNDTSFTFNGLIETETQILDLNALYDLNGVIISEIFSENGVLKRHFERVFPIESDTELTSPPFIISENSEATIVDPLPLSFSYLYFLFLPLLPKIKYKSN